MFLLIKSLPIIDADVTGVAGITKSRPILMWSQIHLVLGRSECYQFIVFSGVVVRVCSQWEWAKNPNRICNMCSLVHKTRKQLEQKQSKKKEYFFVISENANENSFCVWLVYVPTPK